MKIFQKDIDLRWFVSKNRMRYSRGAGWAGMMLAFVNTLTFAKVWQSTFEFYGVPPQLIYFSLPIAYLSICWTIGYIDEIKELWRTEMTYANKVLNKEWCEVCEKIDVMNKNITEINTKMDALKINDRTDEKI